MISMDIYLNFQHFGNSIFWNTTLQIGYALSMHSMTGSNFKKESVTEFIISYINPEINESTIILETTKL